MIRFAVHTAWILSIAGISAPGLATDTGVAASRMLNRQDSQVSPIETPESVQRVRIPIYLQAWNAVATRADKVRQARIPAKPLNHILRARIEKPNDFYLGDWRIQTTPIRWIKSSNQYQVRLEVYRRFGEAGQVEESLGTLNLTGVLQKQNDGLFMVQGSSRRKFNDPQGQPILEIEAGNAQTRESAPLVSKAATDASF